MSAHLELIELGSRAREFLTLDVSENQRGLVATMAESYADALFPEPDDNDPYIPWLRGVLRHGAPAGFIMCADPINANSTPFLWRLLVDKDHQGFGVGRFAVTAALDRYRGMGFTKVSTSWHPRPGGPAGFYQALGFVETGELNEGEVVASIDL
jgi:GNAT superfamily N-acetyltransferase